MTIKILFNIQNTESQRMWKCNLKLEQSLVKLLNETQQLSGDKEPQKASLVSNLAKQKH